jgi:hypothetical protein
MPPLAEVGPRVSPGEYRFLPLSAGIPSDVTRRVHVVNFNDAESVEYVMRRCPIACVITEPVLQNIGVVQSRRVHTDADAISHRRRWRFDLHNTDSANPTMRCDNDCTHQSGYSSLA